jgi:hypothetical protein
MKLNDRKFRRIVAALEQGIPDRQIAIRLSVSIGTVTRIRRGEHVTQRPERMRQRQRTGPPPGFKQRTEYVPTPEVIAAEADAISATWSDEERDRRWRIAHSDGWALGPVGLALVA